MLILTPNPCLDLTLWVNRLSLGSVHRATKNESTAGGKGVNVARALTSLGGKYQLFLMLPTLQGDFYKEKLGNEQIAATYFDVDGEVRKAVIINQNSSKEITVVNGTGPEITSNNWDDYCELAVKSTTEGELVLLMGSMPNAIPDNAIETLSKKVHAKGARLLVDTSPISLKSRKTEVLDFITPNLEEAEALISGEDGNLFLVNEENIQDRAAKAAQELQGNVAKNVFITLGEHGCAFNNGTEKWFLPAFKLSPKLYKSAVGAGDSFVAGLAHYMIMHKSNIEWRDCVKFAMATAAASCESYRAGGLERDRVLQILAGAI